MAALGFRFEGFEASEIDSVSGWGICGGLASDWRGRFGFGGFGWDLNYQFYLVDARTGRLTRITRGDKVQHVYGGWLASGKGLLYADNSRDARFFDCYLMDVASGKASLVLKVDAVLKPTAASVDGRLIAVEETHSEVDNDLWVVDVSSGRSRLVAKHAGHALFSAVGFSADDSTLYYRSNEGGQFMQVMAQSLGSGRVRALTSGSHDVDLAISDLKGRRIAISVNEDGYERPAVVDLSDGSVRQLKSLPRGISWPQKFSPDGSRLSVSADTPVHDDEIYDVDLASGLARRVTDSPQGGIDLLLWCCLG